MRFSALFALAVVLVVGCKTTPETKPASASDSPLLVSLKRTRCNGRCPVYEVRVHENGAVVFTPEANTLATEPVNASLEAARLEKLKALLATASSASWKDVYAAQNTTDLATVELVLGARKISHALGDASAPADLSKFEEDLEATIGTAAWVTGQGAADK